MGIVTLMSVKRGDGEGGVRAWPRLRALCPPRPSPSRARTLVARPALRGSHQAEGLMLEGGEMGLWRGERGAGPAP